MAPGQGLWRGMPGFHRLHAVHQFRPGNERHAKTGQCEQDAAIAGIVRHVMDAALNRTNCDSVGDEKSLKTRLDCKEPADLA